MAIRDEASARDVVCVEPLRPEAHPAAVTILAEAFGWEPHAVPAGAQRLRRYLAVQPEGWLGLRVRASHTAEPQLAGVGGAMLFGESAYLGLIGVARAFQRRGFGRVLTERLCAVAHAKGARRILLDASAAGAPVYRKLGFVAEDEAVVFTADATRVGCASGTSAEAVADGDRAELLALDAEAWRGDRSALLCAHLDDGGGWVQRRNGRVQGFAIAQPTGVGPVIARDLAAAEAVVDAALARDFTSPPKLIVRASHVAMTSLMTRRGFRAERALLHMRLGAARAATPWVWAQESLAAG